MILDSSAILAIQLREPGFEPVLEAVVESNRVLVGAPTVLESILVLSSRVRKDDPRQLVLGFLRSIGAEIIPFTADHMEAAAAAFLRFGKGRHPAALNYGDCIAYAFSAVSGHPLLFTGRDFLKTDVEAALDRRRQSS